MIDATTTLLYKKSADYWTSSNNARKHSRPKSSISTQILEHHFFAGLLWNICNHQWYPTMRFSWD
uniref:Uncharacterized protein n=1 Tax=Rhizophora mucronata TaxID=61149 RepID=A0A2P2QU46_RHIMU